MRWFVALGAAALLTGCDAPNCSNTCAHVFDPGACGITVPGETPEGLIRDCVSRCEEALRNTGELGDYDPNERVSPTIDVELENEKQAAAWMDCVWETAPDASDDQCQSLDPSQGYCAPVY